MSSSPSRHISWRTATSIAVANMVGTGVFTSLGFQLADLETGFALLALWVVGGLVALCGALTYGELAAALPRSGGELNFLSHCYHPAVGFLAGWISLVMGFALPIALAALAFGSYWQRIFPDAGAVATACLIVALVTAAHLINLRLGAWFQNIFTVFKVALIAFFILFTAHSVIVEGQPQAVDFSPSGRAWGEIFSAPFAVALLYVMFAYTGWNAATYIIDEIAEPGRNVPKSLILATFIVAVLYTGLNWSFLIAAPAAEMVGQIEVGHVAAQYVFGEVGSQWMSGLLCIALISSISAMTWAGPRVTQVIGQDYRLFQWFATTNTAGIPARAVACQGLLVIALLLISDFQTLLIYTQFTLALSSSLTVFGVFVLRFRRPDLCRPYRTYGYPWTPIVFLAISLTTLVFTLVQHPWESMAGLITVLVGLPLYLLSPKTLSAETMSPTMKSSPGARPLR